MTSSADSRKLFAGEGLQVWELVGVFSGQPIITDTVQRAWVNILMWLDGFRANQSFLSPSNMKRHGLNN